MIYHVGLTHKKICRQNMIVHHDSLFSVGNLAIFIQDPWLSVPISQ